MQFEFNPDKLYKHLAQEFEPSKKQYRMAKQWKAAKRHHMGKHTIGINYALENKFMRIRAEVRNLYAQHSEYFYDRNWRHDSSENLCTMHTIACSTFYMTLECSYSFEYEIYYHIEGSPFEKEITTLLRSGNKPALIEPNMAAYFEHMRQYYRDNPEYFSHLSPDKV